jgi:hypothetical protein
MQLKRMVMGKSFLFIALDFSLFSRLILEAPLITPNAVEVLKKYCQDEVRLQRSSRMKVVESMQPFAFSSRGSGEMSVNKFVTKQIQAAKHLICTALCVAP